MQYAIPTFHFATHKSRVDAQCASRDSKLWVRSEKRRLFRDRNNLRYAERGTYLVAFNFEHTGAQLAAMPPVDPNITWEFGAYFTTNPYVVFIANDIAAHTGNNDFIVTIASMVHELAHALSNIGGVAGDIPPDDAGNRLEKCVFGGVVQGDGYAYP